MRKIAPALLFVMAVASAAAAQELTVGLSTYRAFGLNDLDGQFPPSMELRFTVPMSDRFALEPFVRAGSDPGRRDQGPEGFFGVQIRQRVVRLTSENGYVFATYGVAGYYSRGGVYPPVIGHFGFGLHRRLSTHLSFRPEVQLVSFHVVPIGVRFVAGLSLY